MAAASNASLRSLRVYHVGFPLPTEHQAGPDLQVLDKNKSPISRTLNLLCITHFFLRHEDLIALSGLHLSFLGLSTCVLAPNASFSALLGLRSALRHTLKTLHIRNTKNLKHGDMDAISQMSIEALHFSDSCLNRNMLLPLWRDASLVQGCRVPPCTAYRGASSNTSFSILALEAEKDGGSRERGAPDCQLAFYGRLKWLSLASCQIGFGEIFAIASLGLEKLELINVCIVCGNLGPIGSPNAPIRRTLRALDIRATQPLAPEDICAVSQMRLADLSLDLAGVYSLTLQPLAAPESVIKNHLRILAVNTSRNIEVADIEAVSRIQLKEFRLGAARSLHCRKILAPILGAGSVLKNTLERLLIFPIQHFSMDDRGIFDDVLRYIDARMQTRAD